MGAVRSMVLVLVTMSVWSQVAAAAGPAISAQEYELYVQWKDGRDDPELAKDNDATKMKKIARSLGVSASALQAAVAKVDPIAGTLKADLEKAITQALDDTPLKGRVMVVEVNTETVHAVAGIKWRCGDERDVDKEASYAALAVAQSGKLVKTLGVWCVNEIDTKLFSAKIGRDAFERIQRDTIERFASSRYIRLFEEVKKGPHS